jgi:thiamine-monophosphate kinase
MADVSDGLGADLGHILEESGVGAILDAEAIPIHPDAIELAKHSGRAPLDHALNDGEDFELVFTVPESDAGEITATELAFRIGRIQASGYEMLRNGRLEPFIPRGWQHSI